MFKSLLSLVTPGNKDKKRKRSTVSPCGVTSSRTDTSYFTDGDDSILNDTSVTLPIIADRRDPSILSPRALGDPHFDSLGIKNRATSFDFCLSGDKSTKDVVVHRRSLQPVSPSPNLPDADHSFIENIFDSPGQRNRLHSVIGDKIYEAGSGSSSKFSNRVSKKL